MILKVGTAKQEAVMGSAPRNEERIALEGGLMTLGTNIATLMP